MNGSGYLLGAVLLTVLATGQTVGAAPQDSQTGKSNLLSAAAAPEKPVTVKSQIYESYKVNNQIDIEIVRSKQKTRASAVRLLKGMEITVLEADTDAKLGDLIRIGTDSDGVSIPSDFWVLANDLLKAGLEQSEMSFDSEDPVLAEQDLESDPVLSEREFQGINNIALAPVNRTMYAFRYVKQYLLRDHIVSYYLPGNSPGQASSVLVKYGFKRTRRNASNAHLHDVCVYRGGNSGNGHVEMKLQGGWWYGYGIHGAVSIKNRQLVGCYSKAPEKAPKKK